MRSSLAGLFFALSALVGPGASHLIGNGEAEPLRGPVLLVTRAESLDAAHARIALPVDPRPLSDEERATALTLAVLPLEQRARLSSALDVLVERLELRQNPLVDDLEGDDPSEALVDLVIEKAPALAAAYALASRRVVTGDRATVIAVARSCDEARGSDPRVRCLPAWSSAREEAAAKASDHASIDPDARRARFFSWPVAMAAMIEVDDPAALARVRTALRLRAAGDESEIAFALAADDLIAHEDDASRSIHEKSRRALQLMRGEAKRQQLLQVLAHDPEPGRSLVPWIDLSPKQLMIVPRLASVSRVDAFVCEVTAAVPGNVRWIRRPAPL